MLISTNAVSGELAGEPAVPRVGDYAGKRVACGNAGAFRRFPMLRVMAASGILGLTVLL
jgi:hypothetical protein